MTFTTQAAPDNNSVRLNKNNVNLYEDETNEYTVPDTCIASYKVVYSNGETYSLKQALEAKKVTIM